MRLAKYSDGLACSAGVPTGDEDIAAAENIVTVFCKHQKKLSTHEKKYRLRVGSYGVLFQLEGSTILVYAVKLAPSSSPNFRGNNLKSKVLL